jgi:hypothetical protein
MSDAPRPDMSRLRAALLPDMSRLRAALLPDLIIAVVGPLLIYRWAAPYLPATEALLLSGILPIVRVVWGLVQRHRLNVIGAAALLTIAVKVLVVLLFTDARLVLVSDSLITAVYGILMLASLLTDTPLIVRVIESLLAGANAVQYQSLLARWQQPAARAAFRVITAVWGAGLLLECGVRVILALNVSIEQFLVLSPIVRYGFLGALALWTFLYMRVRRGRQRTPLDEAPRQPV